MKRGVLADIARYIVLAQVCLRGTHAFSHTRKRFRIEHRVAHHERLQDLAQFVNFFDIVKRKFRHVCAAPRNDGNQALRLEPVQSLTNWGLADSKSTGKKAFSQMLPTIEFAFDDLIADGLVGLLGKILRNSEFQFFPPETRSLRPSIS